MTQMVLEEVPGVLEVLEKYQTFMQRLTWSWRRSLEILEEIVGVLEKGSWSLLAVSMHT